MAFRFDLPDVDDAYALADWFEVMILLSRKPQISKAKILDAIAQKNGSSQQELEPQINFLFREIGRRRRIAGNGYPLIVEGSIIKLDNVSDTEFYKFLLLISLDGPMRRDKRYKEIDEMFDKVVCEATKSYFGEGAESVRFGWPVSDGRPKDFNKALDWLSEKTGIPVVSGASKPHKKDGGVDVVVWKPFADRRTAFVIALIQCTIQASWLPKGKDIIENLWRSRIATAGALTSLAIPFIIKTNFENWDDLRHTVNIIFDRLRLAEMLANRSTASFDKMIKWNKKEISQFVIQ
jgi:hypothetical protein